MRLTLSALALSAALATPTLGLDLQDMSQSDRTALQNEVRSYLLENPEVILEAMAVLETREVAARAEADKNLVAVNAKDLFDSASDWIGGNPEGDVTMVEFIDYRCGYCKRAHPEVAALLEEDGDLRLIRKELPILGEQSLLASRFAIATRTVAGDDAYAAVSDALMAMRSDVTVDQLRQLAATLGLDADPIITEMDSEATTEVIRQNHLLAARLQIQGTPAFVVGGALSRGYRPKDDMKAMVEAARG